jgi:uncharacterized protein
MADSVGVVRSAYEAFARGDVQAVLDLMDDKVEWNEAEHLPYWTGGPLIGPQQVLKGVFVKIGRDFADFTVEVSRLVGYGDTVLSEGRYCGIAKTSGKRLNVQMAHVWDVRDGKIVRFQQYADTWQVARVTDVRPRS